MEGMFEMYIRSKLRVFFHLYLPVLEITWKYFAHISK